MRIVWNMNRDWEFALKRGFDNVGKEAVKKLEFYPVSLPHDWAIESPFNRHMKQGEAQGFRDRWGIGWYQRKFALSDEIFSDRNNKIFRLCFDGIYENSTIWVNDICVGGRKYGYSSFYVDITEALQKGENVILVKVDNTEVPVDRWYSGAGIYRGVRMEILPKLHLEREDIQVITSVEQDKALVEIMTGTDQVVKGILQRENSGCYMAEGRESLKLEISGPELWSAETPNLYELCLQLLDDSGQAVDEVFMKIGLRKIELVPDNGLFVNGKSVKLKGVCIHQEAGCFGTAVQPEIWKERFLQLKAIGCNALRLAHHIFMPQILDLCDELGFYVYEECFDKWTGGAYGRFYQTEWEKDISCMVKRDRNHPSILFWGVGNEVENQGYDSMLKMLEKHVTLVKQLDRTRPVSYAMNPHFAYPAQEVDLAQVKDIQQFVDEMKSGEIFDVDDRVERIKLIADKVDFVSCNYQEQWYEAIHRAIPDKVILGTETYMFFRGFEKKIQNFSDQNPWWDVEKKNYCIGGMIWTGIDYLGESMGYPAKGWSGALFATDMEKRPIAWLYQSYWTKDPIIHFSVMDYSVPDTGTKEHWDYPRYESHWEFPQFDKVVIPYMIATNCEQVEIHVNDKEYLPKPTVEYPNRMITGFLPYFPGKIIIIGKNNGVEVCRQIVETPEMAVRLRFEKEEQTVTLDRCKYPEHGQQEEKESYASYQMLLKVRAYDKEGRPVFRESGKIRFKVEGPAYIAGVDNGDIKTAEPYVNDTIHLFQGRANVAIVVTDIGRVKITAYGSGMFMAQTIVVAE